MKRLTAKVGGALAAVSAFGSVFTTKALAQTDSVDVKSIKGVPVLDGNSTDLMTVVNSVVNIVLVVIGILAVFYMVYGGVMYVTSGGDAEKASKGRTAITNAIIGVVIIMIALLLYNYVVKGVQG